MWEINSLSQFISFLYALALGGIFCLFYDIFRSFRHIFKFGDIAVVFQDIIYFIIISFVTFIFLLSVTNGEIRGYILFGIALGFLICALTISKLFFKILTAFLGVFSCFFRKVRLFAAKIFKNIENTFKKGLKKVKGLLYTKNN